MLAQVVREATQLTPHSLTILGIVSLLVGLANCFFGFRIFRVILAIWGFLVGAALGGALGASANHGGSAGFVVGFILGGLLLAALAYGLYLVGVFLMGATIGAAAAAAISSSLGHQTEPVIVLGVAVLVGIAAVILQKPLIIMMTAFGGAWGALIGLLALLGRPEAARAMEQIRRAGQYGIHRWGEMNPPQFSLTFVVCWLMLGIVGVMVQYGVTSRGYRPPVPPAHKPPPLPPGV